MHLLAPELLLLLLFLAAIFLSFFYSCDDAVRTVVEVVKVLFHLFR